MLDPTSTNKVDHCTTQAPILSNLKSDQDPEISGQSKTKSKPKPEPRKSPKQENEPPSGLGEPDHLGRKLQDEAFGPTRAYSVNTDDGYI